MGDFQTMAQAAPQIAVALTIVGSVALLLKMLLPRHAVTRAEFAALVAEVAAMDKTLGAVKASTLRIETRWEEREKRETAHTSSPNLT